MLDVREARPATCGRVGLADYGLTVRSSAYVSLSEPVVFEQFRANSMVHVYFVLSACDT